MGGRTRPQEAIATPTHRAGRVIDLLSYTGCASPAPGIGST